jgi:N-acetylmuramoyl-L-alanine amidase
MRFFEYSARIGFLGLAFVVTVLFVQHVTNFRLAQLEKVSRYGSTDVATIAERERQLDCLAMNIYKEAGYEPFEGKVAVAQVTMNRVNSTAFPDDVCKVVHQKSKVMEKVVCQFSWYCDRTHKNRAVGKEAYIESMEVAKKVLLEGFKLKMLEGALYYHADYVNPNWRKEKIGKIGQHIFYREKNAKV